MVHTKQQRWVLTLLIGLFFANDPFFAAKFEFDQSAGVAKGITEFHIVSLCFFLVMMMLFWLEIFEELASSEDTRSGGMDEERCELHLPILHQSDAHQPSPLNPRLLATPVPSVTGMTRPRSE
jgi:hypothetical protein